MLKSYFTFGLGCGRISEERAGERGDSDMKTERLGSMEAYVLKRESVTMEELCAQFGVSINTVRRDVAELLKKGTVEKVYGGVCARHAPELTLPAYEARRIDNAGAKAAIGRAAAQLVRDGDIVFLDSGTTTVQVVEHLSARRELTVITNNLEAIVRLLPYEGIEVIALPGRVRRKTNSFTGIEAARALRQYNIRLALMASTGATLTGVTNSSPQEYEIKRTALEISQSAVLLLASAKFGTAGLMTYAAFADFDAVLTEKRPDEAFERAITQGGARLMLTE